MLGISTLLMAERPRFWEKPPTSVPRLIFRPARPFSTPKFNSLKDLLDDQFRSHYDHRKN